MGGDRALCAVVPTGGYMVVGGARVVRDVTAN